MGKTKLLWSCALVIVALERSIVCAQFVRSPCPDIFNYETDGSGTYGKIVLRPNGPASQLVVQINFTVAAKLYSDYYGNLDLENERFALQNYNRGSPMKYRVNFPVTSPLPRCTALSVNGNTICYGPGDVLRPNTYITTFSLQHTSFIQGAGQVFYQNPYPQNDFVNKFGENTEIYNYDLSNSWNNGYSPNYIETTTKRPGYQSSKPINPFYGYENSYDPNVNQPTFNKPPNKPVYEKPSRPPEYAPAPRPPQQQPPFYYTPEETTPVPWQYTTQRTTEWTTQPTTQRTTQWTTPRTTQWTTQWTTQRTTQSPPPQTTQHITECGVVGNVVPLIHQGTTYNRGVLPWLVAIYKNKGSTLTFACGGTLVSERHVITAAHCLHLRRQISNFRDIVVKVGVYDLDAWDDEYTITRTLMAAKIHELYNESTLENDILVLTFKQRVTYNSYIKPACLWSGDNSLDKVAGTTGIVAGWGEQVTGGVLPNTPQMVYLPIVNTETCRASTANLHELTSNTTLCAGDRKGSGPCRGDSGGGLYILDRGRWRLRGVVSKALRQEDGSCNLDEYIVFTDTAQYLPWIRQILTQNYYD